MSGSSLESKQTWGSVNRGTEHRFQQITAPGTKGCYAHTKALPAALGST